MHGTPPTRLRPSLVLLALAAVLAVPWGAAHHVARIDERIVEPYGIQVERHIPIIAGYEPVPPPPVCNYGPANVGLSLLSEDFESHAWTFQTTPLSADQGRNLWTTTTFPGVGSDAGHSAGRRLYFGSPASGDFTGGHTAGTARSPAVMVPALAGSASLTFATKWQVEWLKGYDHLWVEVEEAATGRVHLLCTNDPPDRADPTGVGGDSLVPSCSPVPLGPCPDGLDPLWETRSVSLPATLHGVAVHVRFTFDAADPNANFYLGWMVDDVAVTAVL